MSRQQQLVVLYDAFNRRDLDTIFAHFADDIDWPNGMEGGRVLGVAGVRGYWVHQWAQISSTVEPLSFSPTPESFFLQLATQVSKAAEMRVVTLRMDLIMAGILG